MATNVDEEIDEIVIHVDTECTALLTDGHTNTSDTGNGQSGISRRTRLLTLSTLILHLACMGYSLYLIWLLDYLKDNNNYWCLIVIPFFLNFYPVLLLCKGYHDNDIPHVKEGPAVTTHPSFGVVVNVMTCFTMPGVVNQWFPID